MNPRTTHTTTYFTCRWLVVVLAIFFFVDIHVLPARAQELPETTTETTQELDGQATTIEATQEQSLSSRKSVCVHDIQRHTPQQAVRSDGS